MSRRQQLGFNLLFALWALAQVFFWRWWLNGHNIASLAGYLFNSALLCWFGLLPGYYLHFLGRMKRPNPELPVVEGLRVAMVVTKAPSEPWAVVQKTLTAMVRQDYPHDTWLADEDPSVEALAWCAANNVFVSSRKGVVGYHRQTWPRRTRCKEGNLAYFYDKYGYDAYDIVSQLDADHCPAPRYLTEMVRPFRDPRVGYVSAPSICDANGDLSWSARARLFAESTLHGSLQAGYNGGWAPLCIGSHYTVRTRALREIGGLGPELAEDHSTTLLMNAHGWSGIHAIDAEAHGDGPLSFGDCMVQEFQWSRSITVILLTMLPRFWIRLPARLKFQFLFSELWYPLFGLTMLCGYLAPLVAILTDTPLVRVSYIEFIIHSTPVTLAVILIVLWVRRGGWLRPSNAAILSWEVALFQVSRWPWVLLGCASGAFGVLVRKQFDFKVTPKERIGRQPLPLRLLLPYFLILSVSLLAIVGLRHADHAQGYYYLALSNTLLYLVTVLALLLLFVREQWAK